MKLVLNLFVNFFINMKFRFFQLQKPVLSVLSVVLNSYFFTCSNFIYNLHSGIKNQFLLHLYQSIVYDLRNRLLQPFRKQIDCTVVSGWDVDKKNKRCCMLHLYVVLLIALRSKFDKIPYIYIYIKLWTYLCELVLHFSFRI